MGKIELSLDWLACTFPKEYLDIFYRLVNDTPVPCEMGFRGYTSSALILSKGRVGWSESRSEAHVSLSGHSLALIKKGDTGGLIELIKWVLSVGGHLTRLDIAYDDRSRIVTVADVKEAWRAGNVVTWWKKVATIQSEGRFGVLQGETFNIGSRESDSCLRVYNKALEQQVDGHWVRFELELKDGVATSVAGILVKVWNINEQLFKDVALGFLRGQIKFVDLHSDINPTRRRPLAWWTKFVGDVEKVRVVNVKEQPSIEKTLDWFNNQVAPSYAVIKEAMGSGWPDYSHGLLTNGKKRWRASHRAMVQAG